MNEVLSSGRSRESQFAGLEVIELERGDVLHTAGHRMRHVYFPDSSVISLIATRAQGSNPVEVGLIGREGMLGSALALGAGVSAVRAEVQGAGHARRASVASFTAAMARSDALRRRVLYCNHELTLQVVQTAACNRNHGIEQRVARWLLMLHDRIAGNRLELTQKYLGYVVGARRAGINEVAGVLQRRGLIRWRRGAMEIRDLPGLQAAACECYTVLRQATLR